MNKSDIKLIVSSLLIILIILGIRFIFRNKNNKVAIVYYENKIVSKIDLAINNEYTVDGYNGIVYMEVKDNKIRVKEEVSPKHICSYQGFISETYETIVCLPNKIIIKIEANEELDAVVR